MTDISSPTPQLRIDPMPVGAEVTGLAPGDETDPAIRKALYDAWLKHGVLLFRNVDSVEYHLELSRVFGELEIHPYEPARSAVHPLLIDIGGDKDPPAYVYDETDLLVNRIAWHRDTAYTPDICKGAMLRMVTAPADRGETLIADTAKAYDDLSDAMKQHLETLEFKATLRVDPISQTGPGAIWKAVRPATAAEHAASANDAMHDAANVSKYPPVVHPVVLTHPESGRKCLFLSPTYVDFFIGMDREQSEGLLRQLVDHMLQPQYVLRHKWTANDALIWDNRRCMHAGVGNRPGDKRRGLRTTLAGPLRTGRYYDEEAGGNAPALVD